MSSKIASFFATRSRVDTPFFFTIIALVVMGFFIFSSASLGLLAREGATFSEVAFSQILFGIVGGMIALSITSRINFRFWKHYATALFVLSLIATLLVFVPQIGFEAGGARRWLDIFGFSVQPAEFLKVGYVLFFAAWLSKYRDRLNTWRYGILPFLGTLGVVAAILLAQPDTGTFMVVAITGGAMYLAAGAKLRNLLLMALLFVLALSVLAFSRPYVMDRLLTFVDPMVDPQGAGYQVQQSLIAIGSGGITGRGFGQSVQKFNFLPEPIGDSVFSVAAEEFGFIGSVIIIALFLFFSYRGLYIASHAPDFFGGLLALGIVILIASQSFINIGAMVGVLPLTGMPLHFVSHGGTALLVALAEVGIVLNISRYLRKG